MRTAPLLHLSNPFTCVCSTGNKFETDQTSIDVYKCVVYDHYIGTLCINRKRNYGVNIRLQKDLKNVNNFSQIFEQNINKAF